MAKLILSDVGSLVNHESARETINNNFTEIEQAVDELLSRDGSTPNQMTSDLDMNSNKIMNVADAVTDGEAVNVRTARKILADAGSGDTSIRQDLAQDSAGKGSELVAFNDKAAPSYLKLTSDLLNGIPVNILRNIPKSRWEAIQNRTDTLDCADAIMDLMDGAFNTGAKQIVLRVPLGTFTIHKPIQRLAGSVSFRLIGDDNRRSIIARGSDWAPAVGTGSMFNISEVDGHSIENLRLIANNILYPVNGNHAIATSNSNHVTYRNLYIEDWKNSGILVFHFPGSPPPVSAQEQNNVIENCYLDGRGNANNGILLVDQFYSYIRGCTVRDLGKSGTPQSALQFKNRCYRSHIHDCVAINARHGVAFGQESVTGIAAEQCSATNVLVKDCVWGIYMGSSAYSTIDNINIDMMGQGSHGIEMTDCIENSFTNIYMRQQLSGSGQRSVKFGGTSARNYVQFSVLEIPDTIPEIALYESGTSGNVVKVGLYKGSSPLLYTGQGKLDQTTTPSGNSLSIDGYETQEVQTIAAGVILVKDPATKIVRVDTEAAAATDDLDTITGNGRDGQQIILRTVNASRDVVVKHGTGNIFLKGGVDITLSFLQSRIRLQWDAGTSQWVEA